MAKTFITNNYQPATLQLNGNPCSVITTRALEIEDLGSGAILVGGPTALKPLITLSVSSPHTVGAQTGTQLTVPSASATDPLTSGALSVQANPGTVDLGVLGTTVVTYTVQTSAGDYSSAPLDLVVVDTSSPVLTILGDATMTLAVGATFVDPGFSASDNLDGVITSSVVVSGDTVSTAAPATFTINYSVTDSSNLSAFASRTVVVEDPALHEAAGPWTSPQWFSTGLGSSLTSEVDQLARGTNHVYQVQFSYKRSSDPQGVIFAVTDSSFSDRFYETPATAAAVAFRVDASAGVIVRFPQGHPSWGGAKYFGDAGSVSGHDQTAFNEAVLRVYDMNASSWGPFLSAGSNSYTRAMAKSGSGTLLLPGRTSTWAG